MSELAQPSPPRGRPLLPLVLMLAGFALLLLGQRWQWAESAVTQVPFWDQWFSEAPTLLLYETQGWAVDWVFRGHFSHRIIWNRIGVVLAYLLNGKQWDVQANLTLDAIWMALAPVALFVAVFRLFPATRENWGRYGVYSLIAGIWLSTSLWFNATWSYQTCFALHILFSVLGMVGLVACRERSWGWWGGVAALLIQIPNLASGLVAPAAVLAVYLVEAARERRWAPLRSSSALTALGLTLLALTLALGQQGMSLKGLGADTPGHLLLALSKYFSWPWVEFDATYLLIFGELREEPNEYPWAMLLWLPAPLLFLWALFSPGGGGGLLGPLQFRLITVLGAWAYAHPLLIAFSRGYNGAGPSWRYFGLLAVGLVLNACCLALWSQWCLRRGGWPRLLGGAALALYIVLCVGGLARLHAQGQFELENKRLQGWMQRMNVRKVVATQDHEGLFRTKVMQVPVFTEKQLQIVHRDPYVSPALPAELAPPAPLTALDAGGFARNAPVPGLRAPLYRNYWSHPPGREGAVGNWVLPPLKRSFTALEFAVPPGSPMPEFLVNGPGGERPRVEIWPGTENWSHLAVFRTPPAPAQLKVHTAAGQPMILVEPTDFGQLTWLTEHLRRRAALPMALGGLLLVAGAGLYLRRGLAGARRNGGAQ